MEEMDHQSPMKVEVFTVEHHLLGYVSTGGRRFSAWLNVRDQPIVTLQNVSLR